MLLFYIWFVIPSATTGLSATNALLTNFYLMFVCHPKHKKKKLDQQTNASRLLPVGWIDVQLMMYLVPAQVKFEFSADLNKLYFF